MPDPQPKTQRTFEGTERLGRAMTGAEKAEVAAILRAHDFEGASLAALRFAHGLTGNKAGAQDLLGRARLRLLRFGWDPSEVSLAKRLCRLVWSEWTHALESAETERTGEERFLRETETLEGRAAPSPEDVAATIQAGFDSRAAAKSMMDRLRARFEASRDDVNLLWLDFALRDISEPQQMADLSGRPVTEFYRAADRRKRHVLRLQAEARGVKVREDE